MQLFPQWEDETLVRAEKGGLVRGYEGGKEGGGLGVYSAPAPEAVLGLSNRAAFARLCCGV